MGTELQRRLTDSLTHLEQAILSAKHSIQSLPTRKPELEHRLDEYTEIVRRQREQAASLTTSIEAKEWPEVFRQAQLIRESSSLIQRDVSAVLSEIVLGAQSTATPEFEA